MFIWLCNPVFPQTPIKPSNFLIVAKIFRKQNRITRFDVVNDKKWNMFNTWQTINAGRLARSFFFSSALSFWPRYIGSRSLLSFNYEDPRATRVTLQPGPRWPTARAPTRLQSFTTGLGGGGLQTRRLQSKGRPTFPAQGWKRERCVQMYSLCLCVCVCAATVHSCNTV